MHRIFRSGLSPVVCIVCLAVLSATEDASAAADLDAAALAVFKRNKCGDCHVPVAQRVKDTTTGKLLYPAKRDFSFILDIAKVKASKFIVAGVPERSTLYKMIVKEEMPDGAEFCFGAPCPYPPVSANDIAIIRDWIRALD